VAKTEDPAYFDLPELSERTGVTERTVRYYIQQGLLPAPGAGRGPKYHEGYVHRLRLIRRLQAEHLPLAEIRQRLEAMSDEALSAALRASDSHRSSAAEYIAGVLESGHRGHERGAAAAAAPIVARDAAVDPAGGAASAAELAPDSEPPRYPVARSQWERLTLADDIELHLRRPLSREMNRRLARLLAAAERILHEE